MKLFGILAIMFALLLASLPVAFSLGSLGLGLLVTGGFSPLMAPQAILSTLDGFILLAVPLFLLMSNVLLYGGCGRDLYSAVQAWVGHWPGVAMRPPVWVVDAELHRDVGLRLQLPAALPTFHSDGSFRGKGGP